MISINIKMSTISKCLLLCALITAQTASTNLTNLTNGSKKLSEKHHIENITNSVSGQCDSNSDCKNFGACIPRKDDNSTNYCKCRRNTSGDVCQYIDECVKNPGFCGYKTNAKCAYDFAKGRATCLCKDKSKKFDFRTLECRRTCASWNECNNNPCELSPITAEKFCQCKFGQRGDHCKTCVDECIEQGLDCEAAGAKCDSTADGRAICICPAGRIEMFDSLRKQCRTCDCGNYSFYCKFFNGEKVCTCGRNYYALNGTCKECKCDDLTSNGCRYKNGKVICLCSEDLLQKVYKCQKPCDDRHRCLNGGTCMENVCHCLPGFDGDYCGNFGKCNIYCKENAKSCEYDPSNDAIRCICPVNFKFNHFVGYCRECNCGSDGDCSFDEIGKKVCRCNNGYKEINGKCQICNCGRMSIGCRFDEEESKECYCMNGYAQKFGMCLK